MKKIIIIAIISIMPLMASAETLSEIFRFKIPNPSLITSDWDGDGIPNGEDTDDDNDGIDDNVDDDQFSGRPVLGGASTTPEDDYTYDGSSCDGEIGPETIDNLNSWANTNYTVTEWCDLITLDLRNSSITEIPESIRMLTNIKEIIISNTGLNEIPEYISSLNGLEILNISGTNIESIPDSVVNLVNLEFLLLRNNQLNYIPSNINNLTNLKWLMLNDNQFTSLPSSINNISLDLLNVRNNPGSPFPNINCNNVSGGCSLD